MATLDGQAFQRIQPKQYFTQFVRYNIRPDGRGLRDVREIKVRQGVLNRTCAGSAVVAAGHTRFVAGVTAELGTPLPAAPRSGRIVVSVEFSRNCCADTDAAISGLASQTTWALTQMLSSGEVFDTEQLCVKEGIAVWVLYVTVLCLEYDGSALDWALRAASAALEDTKLPSVVWCPRGKWWRLVADCAARARPERAEGEEALAHALAVPWQGRRLRLSGVPLSLTLLRINADKEAPSWIADPTFAETAQGETLSAWCVVPAAASEADFKPVVTNASLDGVEDVGGWKLLRSGGEPVDVQGALHRLIPVIHFAFQSLRSGLAKAAQEASAEDLWEVCGHDDDNADGSSSSSSSAEDEDRQESPNAGET